MKAARLAQYYFTLFGLPFYFKFKLFSLDDTYSLVIKRVFVKTGVVQVEARRIFSQCSSIASLETILEVVFISEIQAGIVKGCELVVKL